MLNGLRTGCHLKSASSKRNLSISSELEIIFVNDLGNKDEIIDNYAVYTFYQSSKQLWLKSRELHSWSSRFLQWRKWDPSRRTGITIWNAWTSKGPVTEFRSPRWCCKENASDVCIFIIYTHTHAQVHWCIYIFLYIYLYILIYLYVNENWCRLLRLTLDSVPFWYSYWKEALGKEEEIIEKNTWRRS